MIEFTEKETMALLYVIHYVQDKIKSDNLKEDGTFTTQEVRAIERVRVKLAKLLEEIE
ncbi:hypothetical protein [uncultured Methanobrevibacter sp.]|uniref:hypothetical protein n=1 Tax=uncultured Methanobrevibacter sp. TaxID=253161 RepID=UPI0025E9C024|nr:hypothetical protein [uncultured Methanobrevibacter sp.]